MTEFIFCPRCGSAMTDSFLVDRVRRVCTKACGFIHYDNPTPVVAAVVEHDGCVVLAHNRAAPPTWYGLITGFLEHGETPEQGVLREVREELGLVAAQAALIGVYTFERLNQVIIAYHVPATGPITLNEELDDYKRVPPEKCQTWPVATGLALRDWLRSRGFEPQEVPWGSEVVAWRPPG